MYKEYDSLKKVKLNIEISNFNGYDCEKEVLKSGEICNAIGEDEDFYYILEIYKSIKSTQEDSPSGFILREEKNHPAISKAFLKKLENENN